VKNLLVKIISLNKSIKRLKHITCKRTWYFPINWIAISSVPIILKQSKKKQIIICKILTYQWQHSVMQPDQRMHDLQYNIWFGIYY